jgi:membrane protease YdiL (CAAX protease family)
MGLTSIISFLTYLRFFQASFIIEIIGLIVIVVYFVKSIELRLDDSIKNMIGVTPPSLYILLSCTLVFSLPFWLSECFEIDSIVFYRRAFGTYSYSTLIKAPIFEELYFRGILMRFLTQKFSPKKAVLYNGLLFTALHLQLLFVFFNFTLLILMFTIFIFGGLLAYIQYKTKNLLIPITLHAIANLFTILVGLPFEPIITNDAC